MATTTNLGLTTVAEDTTAYWKTVRLEQFGETDSNITKIDDWAGTVNTQLDPLNKALPTQVTNTDTEVTLEMQPNVLYVFSSKLTSLTLTLRTAYDGIESEYKGQFTTGTTVPTVTWPDITWVEEPDILSNMTYQFSILNGVGIIVGVDAGE